MFAAEVMSPNATMILVLLSLALSAPEPQRSATPEFRRITETSGATSYIFEVETAPKLRLFGDRLLAPEGVNVALAAIGLPPVQGPAREEEAITGSRFGRGEYYWRDYPPGTLRVQRSTRGGDDILWKVTLTEAR